MRCGAAGPFFQEEAEGEDGDEPAVGVLFVGGPFVAELATEVEPKDREGSEGKPERPGAWHSGRRRQGGGGYGVRGHGRRIKIRDER